MRNTINSECTTIVQIENSENREKQTEMVNSGNDDIDLIMKEAQRARTLYPKVCCGSVESRNV